MPRLTIDGREIEAKAGQTVMEAAREHGIFIPYFCWHPQLSVPGNCRICVVGVDDKGGRTARVRRAKERRTRKTEHPRVDRASTLTARRPNG